MPRLPGHLVTFQKSAHVFGPSLIRFPSYVSPPDTKRYGTPHSLTPPTPWNAFGSRYFDQSTFSSRPSSQPVATLMAVVLTMSQMRLPVSTCERILASS